MLAGPAFGGEEPKPEDVPCVTIQGMGRAATHAIAAAEAAKRLVRGSHSVTTVGNSVREQVWLPLEEGLDKVVIKQDVACVTIVLSCSPQALAAAAKDAGAVSLGAEDASDVRSLVGYSGPLPAAEVAGGPPGPEGLAAMDMALRQVIEIMQVADPMQPVDMPQRDSGRGRGRGGRGRGRGGRFGGGRGRGRGRGGFHSDFGGFMGGFTAGYGDPGYQAMMAAAQMQAAQGAGAGVAPGSPYMAGGAPGPWGGAPPAGGAPGGPGPAAGQWGWAGAPGGAPGPQGGGVPPASGGMVPGSPGAAAQWAQYQQMQQQQAYQQQQHAAYMQQQ